MTLQERGYVLNDIVVCNNNVKSTGGIIFQIVENCDPVKAVGHTPVHKKRYGRGIRTTQAPTGPTGKKLSPKQLRGYIRLRSLFAFFPTSLGAKPKGMGDTVLLYHDELGYRLQKVDILTLGVKYIELGNVIRDIGTARGIEFSQPTSRVTQENSMSDEGGCS